MTDPDQPVAGAMSQPSAVEALAERYWQAYLELSPTFATQLGDGRFDDQLDDPGPRGRTRARSLYETTLSDAAAIPPDGLGVEDRITLDMLRTACELGVERLDQRVDRLFVVDQLSGPQTLLPQLVQFQRTDTPERLERFLARLEAYPSFMAANVELLQEGLAGGLTAPRIAAERTIAQLERLLAQPPQTSPIVTVPSLADEADRARIEALVRDRVYPANAAFLEALSGSYLAATRADPGLWSAPNGAALYRTQVRSWTSLHLAAEELHRIGLEELETIEAERRVIARELGFGDDTTAARAAILADPANVPGSEEELLGRTRDRIGVASAAAPRCFGLRPIAACEVRAVESFRAIDSPPAYYFPPADDGSRPGIFYVNTYDLPSRSYARLASITFHEAVPGHHFQIALQMERDDLSSFRRVGSWLLSGAYVEGWGLYCERLADELGLYHDAGERFGMLDGQSWRAARLVIDTGLHALGWPRERAVETLLAVGVPETDAGIETDRYIVQPGQALAYKVGQREIERLRREAEAQAIGAGRPFDLTAFHDAVLGHGSLPLATLARELPRWLAEGMATRPA